MAESTRDVQGWVSQVVEEGARAWCLLQRDDVVCAVLIRVEDTHEEAQHVLSLDYLGNRIKHSRSQYHVVVVDMAGVVGEYLENWRTLREVELHPGR
jgi:hypothetical protein